MKLYCLLLVVLALHCSTAFSLSKLPQRSLKAKQSISSSALNRKSHGAASFLLSTEDGASSESAAPEETKVVAAATEVPKKASALWNETTQLVVYLAVWYLGNVYYNIFNKKACIALGKNAHGSSNLHWLLSAVQLLVGVLFVVPQWLTGLRKAPDMTADNWKEIAPVGLFASLAHAFSVLALGAGAVSFGQIVKAGEPVFAAVNSAILLKEIDHPLVYAALLPIIGGVGLASLKELSFTWTALIAASGANQAAALKNVVSKGVMKKEWYKGLGPQNTYAVVTILALLFTLPFVAIFDFKDMAAVYASVMEAGKGADVLKFSALSGLAFYLYNEASFMCLSRLDPVAHSVANTLKRVVIIVASCIVFNTPMTLLGGVGSGIAVLGTLLYSLAKKTYKKK